jgi:hypothetical protein
VKEVRRLGWAGRWASKHGSKECTEQNGWTTLSRGIDVTSKVTYCLAQWRWSQHKVFPSQGGGEGKEEQDQEAEGRRWWPNNTWHEGNWRINNQCFQETVLCRCDGATRKCGTTFQLGDNWWNEYKLVPGIFGRGNQHCIISDRPSLRDRALTDSLPVFFQRNWGTVKKDVVVTFFWHRRNASGCEWYCYSTIA